MKKVTVALCDMQDTYRERLAEYLLHKRGGQLIVYTFSERDVFRKKRKEEAFDLVLLGTGFEKLEAREEEGGLYIRLAESPDFGEEKQPAIFKYQSGEEILRCMFECFLKLNRVNPHISRGKKELIGVYSPSHSRLRTPFALTMAQLLASEKRVLYVNLSEWSGFGDWMGETYQRDLADLLYLMSGYGSQIQGLLECVLHSFNRVDYIPPMADAQLLAVTAEEDYQELLRLLVEKTEYDVIFLDFGSMIPGFFRLLEQCDSIYGVVDKGAFAQGQLRRFELGIAKCGMERLVEKLVYVPVSMEEEQMVEAVLAPQQWLYGGLGDRVRAARYQSSGAN